MDEMENLIAHSTEERSLYKNILPIVESGGFELIRIKIFDESHLTLQIMIDNSIRPLNVDDCARISRNISYELDTQDFFDKEYHLEVSSPGLNRPLTRLKDFDKWKGHKAMVKQKVKDLGINKLEGTLIGLVNSELQVLQNDKIHQIKVSNIEESKLLA